MGCNQATYNLGIRNVIVGELRKQTFCITTKADVAASLNNKYFVVHVPVTNAKHYFWYNVATTGVDPAVPNATGHAIAIASGASAAAVATATSAVLAGLVAIFDSSVVSDLKHITVVMNDDGPAYSARDGFGANKTGFTITTSQFGSTPLDLGGTEGDISFKQDPSFIEITTPQTGDFVLDEIRKGMKVSASFEIKDSSVDSFRRSINYYGSTIVTDDAASDVVTGVGSGNLFVGMSNVATKVVFRPTTNVAEANPAEDFTLHKAVLKMGELTFSAEGEQLIPIEITAYLDQTKSGSANLYSYGDASKVPLA